MFRWYRNAAKCYVYLSDVSTAKQSRSSGHSQLSWEPAFRKSRWFTRGWTLQELLAPVSVEFFSLEGTWLGDKRSLEPQIQQVTGIPVQVLRGDPLSHFSAEERLSWTIRRETTIEEDIVYSVLGIFDIYIPLIYGEGVVNAMRRLAEQIERSSNIHEQRKPTSLLLDLIANPRS
jgi:hypothetical protein